MRPDSKNSSLEGKTFTSTIRGTAVHSSVDASGETHRLGTGGPRLRGITVQDQGAALKQLLALGVLMGMLAAFVFINLPGVQASRLRELQVPSHPGRAPDGLLVASPSQSLQSMVAGLVDESER